MTHYQSIIHRLAPELMIEVAGYLDTPSLGNFRRTCKNINDILSHDFDREFFQVRHAMFEHESLEALMEIAHNPRLAPIVEEVELYATIYAQTQHSVVGQASAFWSRRFEHGYLPREVLISTGQAQTVLSETFSNLPNLRIVRLKQGDVLEDRDRDDTIWYPWGWSYDDTADSESHIIRDRQPWTLIPIMLSALGQSQARPTSLEISLEDILPSLGHAFTFPNKVEVSNVLKDVRSLSLDLQIEHAANSPGVRVTGGATLEESLQLTFEAPLRVAIAHCTSLESLHINIIWMYATGSTLLGWLGGHENQTNSNLPPYLRIASPSLSMLSSLELKEIAAGAEELLAVCSRFMLTSLSLIRIGIRISSFEENSWQKFLLRLARALDFRTHLCRIHLADLWIHLNAKELSFDVRHICFLSHSGKYNTTANANREARSANYDGIRTNGSASAWFTHIAKTIHIAQLSCPKF